MRPGEPGDISQIMDQQHSGFDFTLMGDTVDGDADLVRHGPPLGVRLVQAGNCTAFYGSECTGDGAVGDLGSNGALHHTDCHSESSARAEGEETAPPRMEVRQGVQGVSLFVRGQKYEAVGSSFYQRHRSDP